MNRSRNRKGRRHAAPLMSRERYLEMFGMTPGEIFSAEELRRIDVIVRRDSFYNTVENRK